ncbi:MAG: hypothetical protein IJF13_07990 [Clostridia bacterium]|nr:hypothetical protein [Clostridia bacterium]
MDFQLSGLLIKAIGIFILLAIIGGFVFGIVCLIRLLLKIIKLKQPRIITYYVIMILCILTVAASWILNMGWYRVILTWLAVPFVHPVIFAVINGNVLPNLIYSAKLRVYTLITYITYVLMYAFFPDGGDVGSAYVFFGLINNSTAVHILGVLSTVSLIVYIIFTILQIIENGKVKKKLI